MIARRMPAHPKAFLRRARGQDFETLYAIDQACYSPSIAYTRGELRWYLSLPGAECIVAELTTKTARALQARSIAGFVVSVSGVTHGHLVTMDVLEMHRRKGVASALLRRVESKMKRSGIQDVWLETATNNEPAIAFWKKHGYRTRGVIANYYPSGVDAYVMSKPLSLAEERNRGERHK